MLEVELKKIFSSQITADKTIKITIKSLVETDKFVVSNAMSYANFVIEACPNLTTLHFSLVFSTMPDEMNAKDYLDKSPLV
jgi:hypothetical protein